MTNSVKKFFKKWPKAWTTNTEISVGSEYKSMKKKASKKCPFLNCYILKKVWKAQNSLDEVWRSSGKCPLTSKKKLKYWKKIYPKMFGIDHNSTFKHQLHVLTTLWITLNIPIVRFLRKLLNKRICVTAKVPEIWWKEIQFVH